jgi:hypothetical protein
MNKDERVRLLKGCGMTIESNLSAVNSPEMSVIFYDVKSQIYQAYSRCQDRTPMTALQFLNNFCRDMTTSRHGSLPIAKATVRIILTYLLTEVNLGRKIERAQVLKNIIAKRLIPLSTDELFWIYFERLLVWIRGHCPARSFRQVLQPYEDQIATFSLPAGDHQRDDECLYFIRLIGMFARNFPHVFETNRGQICSNVIKPFLTKSPDVHTAATAAVILILKTGVLDVVPFLTKTLSQFLSVAPEPADLPLYESFGRATSLLIQSFPATAQHFKLSGVPLHLLREKDTQAKLWAIRNVGLFWRIAEDKCRPKAIDILTAIKPLLKKRSVNRVDAMQGLASYLFERKGEGFIDKEKQTLKKC